MTYLMVLIVGVVAGTFVGVVVMAALATAGMASELERGGAPADVDVANAGSPGRSQDSQDSQDRSPGPRVAVPPLGGPVEDPRGELQHADRGGPTRVLESRRLADGNPCTADQSSEQ